MTPSSDRNERTSPTALGDALQALLQFGVLMQRAGNPTVRTREWLDVAARRMGFDDVSANLSLDNITVSICRAGECATAIREIGPPGIDVRRLTELEMLAATVGVKDTPQDIAGRLAAIESLPHRFSGAQIAAAIGAASGGFAFINGAGLFEVIAAGIGAAIGQWCRFRLSSLQLNLYAVVTLSSVIASGCYVIVAALMAHSGLGLASRPAGFMSSVLFLVPGFPLVAALFDLMQHQIVAAVTRFAHGAMVLLVVAFGLSIVIALAGVDLSPQAPLELDYPLKLLLRAVASFAGGCAFAMLYNSPIRTVLTVGVIAVVANDLRLALSDLGMMMAPATYFAAFVVGILALLVRRNTPLIALTVPAIVVMIPGLNAYQMIVLFNRGQALEALQAASSCGFIVGALAMGLATASFLNWKKQQIR